MFNKDFQYPNSEDSHEEMSILTMTNLDVNEIV